MREWRCQKITWILKENKTVLRNRTTATRTALSGDAVEEISSNLRRLLADVFALYVKTKNFHWHMSGQHFRDYHLLLDEQCAQFFAMTDEIAERARKIGGTTIRSMMYRRFGSEVTIVEMGLRLIQREDEDVSEAVKTILENEGINIRLSAECVALEKHSDKIAVNVDGSSGDKRVVGSHVLLAVGRVPNTEDLGLENAGIVVDQRGYIQVDDQLRTNVPGIYALGDCNGRGAFTHTSYNDYEIVAANLLDRDPRRVSDRFTAYALYIDPPLGRAGMTETEARKSGRKVLIGKRPMTRVGRAVEKGETQGFMKILVDAETNESLGASLLGVECDEVIHSILDVMYAKAPYTVIQRAMHIHPTVTELIPTMLGELKPLEATDPG
jgi:pyruvate/2-oxoglutarate dehydrogenase complex dihydrolipoamide dehydrogenase (E3) component